MDQEHTTRRPHLRALSLWLAIGVLVAAAFLGSIFIIFGDQASIAGRAWLTLLLAAAFAGTVVADAGMPEGPNRWYLPVSTGLNALLVVVGLLKTWGGFFQPADTADKIVWSEQLFLFVWIVCLLRAALIVTQTYGHRFVRRASSPVTRVFAATALVFVWVIAILLSLPPALPEVEWPDVWWRMLGAATLVTAVMFLIPVIVFAFEPKKPRPPSVPWTSGPNAHPFFGTPPAVMQQTLHHDPGAAPAAHTPAAGQEQEAPDADRAGTPSA